jgi:hypothetical protein
MADYEPLPHGFNVISAGSAQGMVIIGDGGRENIRRQGRSPAQTDQTKVYLNLGLSYANLSRQYLDSIFSSQEIKSLFKKYPSYRVRFTRIYPPLQEVEIELSGPTTEIGIFQQQLIQHLTPWGGIRFLGEATNLEII